MVRIEINCDGSALHDDIIGELGRILSTVPSKIEYFIDKQIDYRKAGILKELTKVVDDRIDEKKKELTAAMAEKIAAKLA